MGGTNPILECNTSLIPIKMNMNLPAIPINKDVENITGFIIHGANLSSTSHQAYDNSCGGKMCDKNAMYKGGRVSHSCACFTMSNGRNYLPGIAMNLMIRERSGNMFESFDYSSQKFLATYIFNGEFPIGTRQSALADWEMDERIITTTDNVFRSINNAGGWTVIGWTKMGHVRDEAAPEGPRGAFNGQNEEAKVEAGTLKYHISSLFPTTPQDVNLVQMDSYRIDLTSAPAAAPVAANVGN